MNQPFLGYVSRRIRTVLLDDVRDEDIDPSSFDLLFESPVPQNPNRPRELAERFGLKEVARFEVGAQRVVLWGRGQPGVN